MSSRILFLKFPLHSNFGGGEVHTLDIFTDLQIRGVKCYLLTSCPVLISEFKKRSFYVKRIWGGFEPVSLVNLFWFTLTLPLVLPWTFFYLLYFRLRHKITHLYCQLLTEKLLATPLARLLGMKVVWMEHLQIERWLFKNPYRKFYSWFSRQVKVVAVARAIADQLLELNVPPDNIVYIPSGVDTEMFKPKSVDRHYGENIIGTVSRLAIEKGVDNLITAFCNLKKKYPNTRLLIVGDGDQKENLIALANKLGADNSIEFLGKLEHNQLPDFYARLDFFSLLSRRRESFGIVAAEAQSAGKPVVAANISGLAEVVKDQETGLVVPIDDVGAATQALEKLIANPDLRAQMGLSARSRVEKYFSKNQMLEKFYQLFN